MQFKDKITLITGAASGIGKATALHFAQEGSNIIVSDIQEEAGMETVSQIEAMGRKAIFVRTDVSKLEDHQNLMSQILQTFGKLDIAINNAGIGGEWNRMAEASVEDYRKVMAINVDGVFFGMQLQIQQMLTQTEGGNIINISSIAGLRGLANCSAYSASKHAVLGLTKSAALEYARKNIRINAVCPVFTRTPLFDKTFEVNPAYEEKLKAVIPMKRYGQPEDIAKTIAWLCSDSAGFVMGQAIAVDGGMTAG